VYSPFIIRSNASSVSRCQASHAHGLYHHPNTRPWLSGKLCRFLSGALGWRTMLNSPVAVVDRTAAPSRVLSSQTTRRKFEAQDPEYRARKGDSRRTCFQASPPLSRPQPVLLFPPKLCGRFHGQYSQTQLSRSRQSHTFRLGLLTLPRSRLRMCSVGPHSASRPTVAADDVFVRYLVNIDDPAVFCTDDYIPSAHYLKTPQPLRT
jgi:hypothetical protein